LPLQNESKKELRVLLKELESIKQLQDFNTALNTTLNTAIEKLDVNTIKQTINRNQEFVNTTGLTFGYTPLIAIIAKKDLSEGDREKQRAIFKYLLSVSGIDVHKMSDEKDPKNNRNALDAVLLKVSTSKNNKVLNDHYRKMAKNLIDLGVKLKKFATQPQAQEILQELKC
jgi:ethanolamine utilization protein EutP (predicted NTPase)